MFIHVASGAVPAASMVRSLATLPSGAALTVMLGNRLLKGGTT